MIGDSILARCEVAVAEGSGSSRSGRTSTSPGWRAPTWLVKRPQWRAVAPPALAGLVVGKSLHRVRWWWFSRCENLRRPAAQRLAVASTLLGPTRATRWYAGGVLAARELLPRLLRSKRERLLHAMRWECRFVGALHARRRTDHWLEDIVTAGRTLGHFAIAKVEDDLGDDR